MCGFVVSIGNIKESNLIKATESIKYRGPDDTNYYIDKNKKIFIGHNRLEIMDPDFGKQPVLNEDNQIILAYNGEIFNQYELREELIKNNINFKSISSDTEVVLKGYQFWGTSLFNKLDGQFAITILDLTKNKVILSRDKFGEKPLYYHADKEKIIIGSELKIFKNFENVNLITNEIGLKKYFVYSFIPAPMTLYKNIYKVKHAQTVEINLTSKVISKNNYYKPLIKKNKNISDSDLIESLDAVMKKSVKSRLLSDSKIGVFLSGGLDSSLISFYAKENNPKLESFSISVKEKTFDEIDRAEQMSEVLKIKLNKTHITQETFKQDFKNIISKLDEPIGAPTYIPMYYLSKLTSNHVKSVLSGDGADEIFGGYENFKYISIFKMINNLKINKLFSKINNLVKMLPISKSNLSIDFKLRRFSQGMEVNQKYQNTFFLSPLSVNDLEDLFNEKIDLEEILEDVTLFENEYKDANFLDKNYLYFINFYIPDLISARADKAGMLNSLEIRSPFLNSEILELMLSIPSKKAYLIKEKNILKKLIHKKFNSNFFNIKKGGFTYPIQKWLNVSEINHIDIFNKEKFIKMKSSHIENKNEYRNFFHCCEVIKNFI